MAGVCTLCTCTATAAAIFIHKLIFIPHPKWGNKHYQVWLFKQVQLETETCMTAFTVNKNIWAGINICNEAENKWVPFLPCTALAWIPDCFARALQLRPRASLNGWGMISIFPPIYQQPPFSQLKTLNLASINNKYTIRSIVCEASCQVIKVIQVI